MIFLELSIITSVYNEKENIRLVLNELKDFAVRFGSAEVIVVDDGSTDSTSKIVDEYKKYRQFKIVHQVPNQGKGAGVARGIRESKGRFIALIDSDGENPPKEIKKLLNELKKNNGLGAVIGWRVERKSPLARKVYSAFYNLLVTVLFGINCKDIGGQPRVFERQAIEGYKIKSKRWVIEVELPHAVKQNGYGVAFVKVEHRPRHGGEGKVRFRTIFNIFADLIKLRLGVL